MRKKRKDDIPDAHALYIAMIDRLVGVAPRGMKSTMIVWTENTGPMIFGSCCDDCAAALIHAAADRCQDPRIDEEEAKPTNLH